jgi:RNase P subunit RPR2
LVELEVLFENLRYCKNCRLGPVTLSVNTIRGELQKGLSGYLYVECQNCRFVNYAAYGKTHRTSSKNQQIKECHASL